MVEMEKLRDPPLETRQCASVGTYTSKKIVLGFKYGTVP
jgi:hypothetical protein